MLKQNLNRLKIIKYFLFFILVFLPLFTNSQTFKSYGINFGTTFYENGWNNPDTFSYYYHDKVYISTYTIGLYGEFLSWKPASTILDLSFRFRKYHFQYDRGGIGDAAVFDNNIVLTSLSVYEKFRADFDRWSIYAFGGFRADLRISKTIEKDFQNVFGDSKSVIFGTTAGIGFSKRFARFWRISFELYYDQDLTKMYESSIGDIKNKGVGFKIGFGPFNPKNK